MTTHELASRFEAYGHWRRRLAASVADFGRWLAEQDLADARIESRLRQVQDTLAQDRLTVAFVAEFSRGKSELINAIFFADFGQRLLPSAAGRTTMCPTELSYDPLLAPSIRLLPIETRAQRAGVAEFRRYSDEWETVALDLARADRVAEALSTVADVKNVPAALAAQYGLHDATPSAPASGEAPLVEIPRWRHAIINFPHPLLQEGLVVLDTPGLNAIGIEPELTLNQLPDAQAVLFVLAADAGVTRSDLEVWTQHLARDDATPAAARIVVLNKIDGLWDELKAESAVDAEIRRQGEHTARVLGVPPDRVFPVSAQKALLAKVNGDDALLAKSRLPALERTLSESLLPAKRDLVGGMVDAEARAIAAEVHAILATRRAGEDAHHAELASLRGKNQGVIDHQMARVRDEKAEFERGLQQYTAVRTALTELATRLLDCISPDTLRRTCARTRREIEASPFTKGIRTAMSDFFGAIREDLARASAAATEIEEMMRAVYARRAAGHAPSRITPPPFSMFRYKKEIARLEQAHNAQFNTLWNMLSMAKFALTQRFFETIASRVRHVYDIANRDIEAWLRAVVAPLETEVKEQHAQLRRRLESIRRIHGASGELEARVAEIEEAKAALAAQERALDDMLAAIDSVIRQPDLLPLAANG
jgi:hypothetical protein